MRVEIKDIRRSQAVPLNSEKPGGFKLETNQYCTTREHRNSLLNEAEGLKTYLNLTEASIEPKPGPTYRLVLRRLVQISHFLHNSRLVAANPV